MTDIMEIARAMAEAVAGNRALVRDLGAVTVEIGFDAERQDWSEAAPFAVLEPLSSVPDSAGYEEHSLEMVLGVADSFRSERDGFTESAGHALLSGIFLPECLGAFASLPWQIDVESVTYSAEEQPLYLADVTLAVRIPAPV